MADAPLEDRPRSRRLTSLRPALAFLRPYRWAVVGASIALVLTASVTLSVGQGVRLLIDEGFANGSPELLVRSLLVFLAMVLASAVGTGVVSTSYPGWENG